MNSEFAIDPKLAMRDLSQISLKIETRYLSNNYRVVGVIISLVLSTSCGGSRHEKAVEDGQKHYPIEPNPSDGRFFLDPLIENASKAVVAVRIKPKKDSLNRPELTEWFLGPNAKKHDAGDKFYWGMSSGIIIDQRGYVITANRLLEDSAEIEVQLSEDQVYKAELVGVDERSDLAMVRLKNIKPGTGLPEAQFGNSEEITAGDPVVAIGRSRGTGYTGSLGIISKRPRSWGTGQYRDLILTDAVMYDENPGGPLVNLRGEVVAVITEHVTEMGASIAIPSNLASQAIDDIFAILDGNASRSGIARTGQVESTESRPTDKGQVTVSDTATSFCSVDFPSETEVVLGQDGCVATATLRTQATILGFLFKAGTRLEFAPPPHILKAYLSQIVTLNGVAYRPGEPVEFDESGQPCRGILASSTRLRHLKGPIDSIMESDSVRKIAQPKAPLFQSLDALPLMAGKRVVFCEKRLVCEGTLSEPIRFEENSPNALAVGTRISLGKNQAGRLLITLGE
jgi:S1-C subfamily serine protease